MLLKTNAREGWIVLFKNDGSSLRLEVSSYEFPDGGVPGSDDGNWLVLRCTWVREDGSIRKDTNSCLLTYELQALAAGLKVLRAGIRDSYASDFVDPYFEAAVQAEGEGFRTDVSFYLPNTMDGDDTAEIETVMSREELDAWIEELDGLCARFPDRT